MENIAEFQIRFAGALEEIDASTLVDTLGNLSVVIHEINDELQPHKSVRVTIKAIRPGSFDIFLVIKDALIDNLGQYLTRNGIDVTASIVLILWGLLEIRKHLRGQKPSKTEKGNRETVLINADGDSISIKNEIYNIYAENQLIDAALGKSFDVLEADESVDGFEMLEKAKLLFRADRKDFKALSCPSVLPEKDTRILKEDAILNVFKIVFEKGYKWQFYYKGIKIHAEIKDEAFYKAIDAGTKFSKGDTLIVELEITQVFDKTVQTHVNKEYKIKRIRQHIARKPETQGSLFNSDA